MQLVTGASGFLGRHLVRRLSAGGRQVKALYYRNAPDAALSSLPNVEWICCDLLDIYAVEEAMQGVQDVYHCAALVSFQKGDKQRLLHFNVESTANIVNQALEQGIRKIVYASSVASLGRKAGPVKEITEDDQWEESKYNSVYSLSKYLAEIEVWRGMGEGLSAAIVNPGIILGEGNWEEGSARLMKVVDEEFPFYTKGINAWVDVQDVAAAMIRLMDSDVKGERFILSAGNFAYKDVFTLMAKALGRKPPHIAAGNMLSGLVWRWNTLRSLFGAKPSVTKETARTAQKQVFYNNEKLKQFLPGFTYTPLEETIARMAKAYKEQKN